MKDALDHLMSLSDEELQKKFDEADGSVYLPFVDCELSKVKPD